MPGFGVARRTVPQRGPVRMACLRHDDCDPFGAPSRVFHSE